LTQTAVNNITVYLVIYGIGTRDLIIPNITVITENRFGEVKGKKMRPHSVFFRKLSRIKNRSNLEYIKKRVTMQIFIARKNIYSS